MKFTIGLVALAFVPALALPPASFGFPQSQGDAQLSVQFQVNGSALSVRPGALFGIDVPSRAPTVAVNESYASLDSSYAGEYLLFMLDPDASYPQNPTNRWIIHWWQTGLVRSTAGTNDSSIGGTLLVNNTAPRVAYRRPAPPTNSSAHRYIQYLFEQPTNFQIPPIYSGYNATNASRFPFERFVSDANLGNPVAANYFYCSNQTVVPDLFVASPGEQYPGGNGAMITQGTNLPSSTSASPSVTGSSTTGGVPTATYTGMASMYSSSGNFITALVAGLGAWLLS